MPSGDGSTKSSTKTSTKPKYSRFTQQELPACKPILTPGLVMAAFLILGLAFIPIGLSHLSASDSVVQLIDRYDEACIPADNSNPEEAMVPQKMKQPIFVYYQLDEFYQNHRRYVRSRNDQQYGSASAERKTANCDPEAEVNGNPIVPCGLIAWSLFNDTYSLSRNDVALPINKNGIAWESDKTSRFGSDVYPKNFQTRSPIGGGKLNEKIPLNQQEDLLVWMRTATLPSFRKLYGRIETDLEENEIIKVVIQNNYNTYTFSGKKKLVISTTTWIGGKNDFLGRVYVTVGGICLLIAITYIIFYLVKPRPLGDPAYLSWNKVPASN
ncbi:UNVERIFIED_CONTAM: ALA-interacting subunit [Sesamum calycinum]|uniref:ALA-interacting subunit n=1 Tax=Sesamum calycinum TaxID=2727403 RepID=A0AAW2LZ01_9LAMI